MAGSDRISVVANLEMCDEIPGRLRNKGVALELGTELIPPLDRNAADAGRTFLATVGAQRAAQIGSVEAGSHANAVHLFPIGQR